ncbi:MAG: hypothetical protein WC350_06080 [Candidatus Micrarchaeia archaeon]|jgi:hypothetical protein
MAKPNKSYRIVVVQTTRTEVDVPAYSLEHAKELMVDCTRENDPAQPPEGLVTVNKTVEKTVVKKGVSPRKKPPAAPPAAAGLASAVGSPPGMGGVYTSTEE